MSHDTGHAPLSAAAYEAALAALADVVADETIPGRDLTLRVAHGLPSSNIPLQQPALSAWWRERVDPARLADVVAGIAAVAEGSQHSWMDQYDFRWSDDTVLHVVHRVIILPGREGDARRMMHLFQDATARRRAQAEQAAERRDLEQRVAERTHALALKNAELRRAARHKDDFLASMSHELRTPLNAVIGLTDALLEGVGGPLTTQQEEWLRHIVASGQHLLGLINDILDLARIESGRVQMEPQCVIPSEEMEAVLHLVQGSGLPHAVQVRCDLADDLPPLVTEPRFLRQILVNLLGNAVKFTPPDGAVTFSSRSDGDHLLFQVRDTGPGIPPDRLADIFQPFVQLDSGLDRAVGGTGLGLALVAKLTERLGGSVAVASELGQGSTFTVRLPLTPCDAAPPAIDEADSLPSGPSAELLGRPLRILVAEDNPANGRTFLDYLSAKGMQVSVVTDGAAAVEAATTQPPDLILMDIQMPGMDGLQATRLIRQDARLRHVPVIALTALAMPGDRERCLTAGANAYLPKPVRLRELTATIHQLTLTAQHP